MLNTSCKELSQVHKGTAYGKRMLENLCVAYYTDYRMPNKVQLDPSESAMLQNLVSLQFHVDIEICSIKSS